MNQSLQLNIIPFTSPVEDITIPFSISKDQGLYSLYLDDDVKELVGNKMSRLELLENKRIYTDFGTPKENSFLITININTHPHLALHYFKHLIHSYFRNGVAHIMRRNFTDDIEVWFLNSDESKNSYNIYDKFTLTVNHANVTSGFELVVSYDGTSKVGKRSLKDIPNFNTEYLNLVNCDGLIKKWTYLEPEAKLHLDKIFPIIGVKLYQTYKITYDIPDNKNRYPRYFRPINEFYEKYLDNEKFRSILPLDNNGYIKNYTATVNNLSENSTILQFGKNKGSEPKTDLKLHGPCQPIPAPNNVTFFFIYHKDSQAEYQLVKTYFEKGFKSHPNLQDFIYQPFYIDESLNIVFNNIETAIKDVHTILNNYVKKPNTKYFILYITPVSKFETNNINKGVYYRMKEMFLHLGYYSQVLYKNYIRKWDRASNQLIPNDYYHLFLPNIQSAILAKLGGIPWRLDREDDEELIIGIGAFYCYTQKAKFLGSAFCFDNRGRFKNFDCFAEKELPSLVGCIRQAVITFLEKMPTASRIIIHFYKVMSQKELKPIMDMIYHDLKLDIPIIVVTINKTVSKELLAFDTSSPLTLMPLSGTYIRMAERQYLLFNNTRYNKNSTVSEKEYHFPIKIKLTSTHLELLEDNALVEKLIDQVYQFSRMYWKSVSHSYIPVTIAYPEMVADTFSHFKQNTIPAFGQDNLWFL